MMPSPNPCMIYSASLAGDRRSLWGLELNTWFSAVIIVSLTSPRPVSQCNSPSDSPEVLLPSFDHPAQRTKICCSDAISPTLIGKNRHNNGRRDSPRWAQILHDWWHKQNVLGHNSLLDPFLLVRATFLEPRPPRGLQGRLGELVS